MENSKNRFTIYALVQMLVFIVLVPFLHVAHFVELALVGSLGLCPD